MSITIINPGFLTTVQDLGRYGYQSFGVSVAGACDKYSAALANILVGNEPSAPLLEATFMGPMLRFNSSTTIAITGGNLSPSLNGLPLSLSKAIAVLPGDMLSFGFPQGGCRAYIACAGGLGLDPVMGSCATDLKAKIGGYEGRRLEKGDQIPLKKAPSLTNLEARQLPPHFLTQEVYTIRILKGEQYGAFKQEAQENLEKAIYTLTPNHDRMGMRLEGPALQHVGGPDVISEPVSFGTVQVPGNGQPIIMLADCQTIGGYTKIAHVATVDYGVLGQLKAGDKLRFKLITLEEAQRLLKIQQEIFTLTNQLLNG